jgi:hypothetical protein
MRPACGMVSQSHIYDNSVIMCSRAALLPWCGPGLSQQRQTACEPEHHVRASAGAVQLGSVGVALSVFGSATKLMNVPLLSVTTQIVATAVGSNEGAPGPCPRPAHACPLSYHLDLAVERPGCVLPVAKKKDLEEACSSTCMSQAGNDAALLRAA